MTKELEWLDYMESICKEFLSRKEKYMQLNFTNEHAVKIIKIVDTIKQLLTRLESIDNANPSEALEKELNLMQQQKDNLLHKQSRAKTDNEIKYWQFRIDKFNEKISAFTNIKQALLKAQEIERLLDHERELNNHLILKAQEQEKILNILKPMLMIKKGSGDYYLDIQHYNFQDREEERIIRSWLDNE